MLAAVITIAAAVAVYTAVLLLVGNSPKERIRTRLDRLTENTGLEHIHDVVLSENKRSRKEKKKLKLVSVSFEQYLESSGIRLSAQEFIMLWIALVLGPAIIGALLEVKIFAVIGMCILGFIIPPILVKQSRSKREILFNKQLGEALTVMSNCIRSGYSFQQALGSVAKEMQPPISTEFSRVVQELNYGVGMEDALNHMVARVKNKDLELLVSAVVTSLQVGANLSDILDTISETVSDRIKLREEVRVASAQGKISGIIIGLLPAAMMLFLMIVNPDYMAGFFANTIGRILLGVSVVLDALGFFVITKVVDIKY